MDVPKVFHAYLFEYVWFSYIYQLKHNINKRKNVCKIEIVKSVLSNHHSDPRNSEAMEEQSFNMKKYMTCKIM